MNTQKLRAILKAYSLGIQEGNQILKQTITNWKEERKKEREKQRREEERKIKKLLETTNHKTIKLKNELPVIGKQELDTKHLTPPLLFLMRQNGDIEIKEDVPEGLYIIKAKTEQDDRAINLTERKKHSLIYNKTRIPCWIAYEGEFNAYPSDIIMDSKAVFAVIRQIIMQNNDLKSDENKGGWMQILLTIGLIVAGIVLIYFMFKYLGVFKLLGINL